MPILPPEDYYYPDGYGRYDRLQQRLCIKLPRPQATVTGSGDTAAIRRGRKPAIWTRTGPRHVIPIRSVQDDAPGDYIVSGRD